MLLATSKSSKRQSKVMLPTWYLGHISCHLPCITLDSYSLGLYNQFSNILYLLSPYPRRCIRMRSSAILEKLNHVSRFMLWVKPRTIPDPTMYPNPGSFTPNSRELHYSNLPPPNNPPTTFLRTSAPLNIFCSLRFSVFITAALFSFSLAK